MKILTAESSTNYRLLDSGDGYKLEQFGSNTIIRPDSNCVWKPRLDKEEWAKASAFFKSAWDQKKSFKAAWFFTYALPQGTGVESKSITCQLRLSQSKNIGIFPEQSANWAWMADIIASAKDSPKVLNLFGYTGAASLVAAAAGAEVCHVDAAKSTITWASENQKLSGLTNAPIRWIVDDCATFLNREIKRGVQYDALIMDPPAFGRDSKGKIFAFEKQIYDLLVLCSKVLKPKPLFIIFNGYSMGYSATVLYNLLHEIFPKQHRIEFGELQIPEWKNERNLPSSLFARFGG